MGNYYFGRGVYICDQIHRTLYNVHRTLYNIMTMQTMTHRFLYSLLIRIPEKHVQIVPDQDYLVVFMNKRFTVIKCYKMAVTYSII